MNIFSGIATAIAHSAEARAREHNERMARSRQNVRPSAELQNAISTKVYTFDGVLLEDLSRDDLLLAAKMAIAEREYWRRLNIQPFEVDEGAK